MNELDPRNAREREGEAPAEPPLPPASRRDTTAAKKAEALAEPQPKRKHPAHGVLIDEHNPTIVFDTVCSKDRVPVLANADVHALLRKVWNAATFWRVGRYVIMPDHIHLFAGLGPDEIDYQKWVQYWKSQFTKQYRAEFGKAPPGKWQTDDWDTRMRRFESYDQKWQYVVNNPVRHGLVERAEEWPFQGEIFELRWD